MAISLGDNSQMVLQLSSEENPHNHPATDENNVLTTDELIALRLWASALKQSAIAETMQISTAQVERVFASVKKKLGARNAIQVGVIAARLGLLR